MHSQSMMMNRLLYEKSIAYLGHLIIPYVFGKADIEEIYSYKLLSALENKGQFHRADNPAGIYSNSGESIVEIARQHLDEHSDLTVDIDLFKNRYTYRENLIIVHEVAGSYFYDCYQPHRLSNVAARRIFTSEAACIQWIKEDFDRGHKPPNPLDISW